MGNNDNYKYGPVTDYSIKTTMSDNTPGRGWTWGIHNKQPIAALNTQGNLKVKGYIDASEIRVNGNPISAGGTSFWTAEGNDISYNSGNVNARGMTLHWKKNNNSSTFFNMISQNSGESRIQFKSYNPTTEVLTNAFSISNRATGLLEIQHPDHGALTRYKGNGDIFFYPNNELSINGNLKVEGDIRVIGSGVIAEKLVATVNPTNFAWPDYVFTDEYKLPSLESIENHINKEGHLPGVPSAEQINKGGIDLGRMDAISMEKIEQLMLHTIEQGKQLQQQNEEIAKLLIRIEELEAEKANKQ